MSSFQSPTSSSYNSGGDESLWLKLLRETSNRAMTPEASCIVVGDADMAKTNVMSSLGQNGGSSNEVYQESSSLLDMICYDYLDVEDGALESATKVHLWNFDERLFGLSSDLLPPVKTSSSLHKLMYIVAVDLTKRETEIIQTVRHWLRVIADQLSVYYGNISDEEVTILKQNYLHYLATVRLHKGNVANDMNTTEQDQLIATVSEKYQFANNQFFVPIVVVGCKSELLNFNDVSTLRQVKEIQGKLRQLCLDVGAALIFPNNKEQDSQKYTTLKNYLIHRLYSNNIRMELGLEEKIEQTFIPSGFDTLDLISISTGQHHWNTEEFRNFIASPLQPTSLTLAEQSNGQTTAQNFSEIETEQEWLNSLQSFISTMSASGDAPKVVANLTDLLNEADSEPKGKPSTRSSAASSAATATAGTTTTTSTRRSSVRTTAPLVGGEKKDVKDFFQNLLANPNPKK